MSVDARNRVARLDRGARIAGAGLFLTNGALFTDLVPRFPEIKADIGIDNAVYGVAVAAFPTGAFLTGVAAAVLVRRFGSANVAVAGTVLTGIASIAVGLAPSTAVFMAGLFFAATLAAAGYVALVVGQFLGRIFGDRLVDSFGPRSVARVGGLIAAVGMGSVLLFPTIPGTVLGFCLAGLGVATLVPVALHEADELPGLRPGTGLTVVSWLMRLGFLLCPPLVGSIAQATELRVGLMVVLLAGVLRSGPAARPGRDNGQGPPGADPGAARKRVWSRPPRRGAPPAGRRGRPR